MPYNPETVKKATEIIGKRRENNLKQSEARREEINKKIPEYAALKREMISLMGESVSNVSNPKFDKEKLKSKLSEIGRKKRAMLVSCGYPEDYCDDKYDCCKCSDKGYTEKGRCECFKKILKQVAAEQSNLSFVLANQNFSSFNYKLFSSEKTENDISPKENMKNILKKVTKFINDFDNFKTGNLLFTGKPGVGKTFLAGCIANELLERDYDVFYQSACRISEIADDYRFRRGEDTNTVSDYKRLFETDLLIIDDLGCEYVNALTISYLYEIINKRIISGKKMIITTNFSLKELNEVYAERLFSRFVGNFNVIEFIGDDLRLKEKI